jgi:hypothetical protein
MTIQQRIAAVQTEAQTNARVGEFFKCARLLVQAGGVRSHAHQLAQVTHATPRVVVIRPH